MRLLSCCCLLVLVYGCGGAPADAPQLAPVEGVVTLQGKPLPNATVTFYPEKGPAGIGMADEQGAFKVKTNGSSGAVLGACKVTVSDGTPVGAEIPPADGNEVQLLKKATLPEKYRDKDKTDLIVTVPAEGIKDLKLEL